MFKYIVQALSLFPKNATLESSLNEMQAKLVLPEGIYHYYLNKTLGVLLISNKPVLE